MIDYEEVKLRVIRDQARLAREYFENHDALAYEITERYHLGDIEFLLSVIDKLSRREE